MGNVVESCINGLFERADSINYLVCLEQSTSDWTAQAEKCAKQLNLDYSKVASCIDPKSTQGVQFVVENAIATEKLSPAHQYVPWVVVNGVHDSKSENAVRSNFVKYVCDTYKGTTKIAACI